MSRVRPSIPFIILGAVLSVLIGQAQTALVSAQTPQSQVITMSPASTDIFVDPGATVSKKFEVINSGASEFNVTLSSAPYRVVNDTYDPLFTQLPGTVDASRWVTLSATKAKLAGNKLVAVDYTVSVPQGTPAGGYYAVIFAETNTDDERTGVVSRSRVGNILYITVNGNVSTDGSLAGYTLPFFHLTGPLTVSATITNSGGKHFITKSDYYVTDLSGKEIFRATNERYVLPQTQRTIASIWSPTQLIGIFTIHREATIAGELKALPNATIVIFNPWFIIAITFLLGILIGIPVKRARQQALKRKK